MIGKRIRQLLGAFAAARALKPRTLVGAGIAAALALTGLIGGGSIVAGRIASDDGSRGGILDFVRSAWKGGKGAEMPFWHDSDSFDDDPASGLHAYRRKTRLGTPATPEDIASIRRNGMVLRDGKWLPAKLVPPSGPRSRGGASGGGSDHVAVQLFITTGSVPEGTLGKPYSAAIQATGGTPPYTWNLSGALPQGLQLTAGTGALAGTPRELFSATIRVRVRDAASATDEAEFLLVILPQNALRIVTESLAEARPGEPYAAALEAAGGVSPYEWSLDGQLPPGLAASSSGSISGTPTGDLKEYPLSITVTDSQGTQSVKALTLKVGTADLRITSPPELEPIQMGKPADLAMEADGGTPPYRWELLAGTLPAGVSFSGGVFTGTPGEIGRYGPLSVAVWDTATPEPRVVSGEFYIEVTEAPIGPVTDLEVHPSRRKAVLTWRNPDAPDFSETLVVRSTGAVPETPDEGELVYQGPEETALDDGLAEGVTYHYAAFAFNTAGESSALEDTSYNSADILPFTTGRAGTGQADPHADSAQFTPLTGATRYNSSRLPGIVLGPPQGGGLSAGSGDVVSLGAAVANSGSAPYGGSIVLAFTDNVIIDGPGVDFTVFENAFYIGGDPENRFMEPAIVSVSQDGVRWETFPFDFSPRYVNGTLNLRHPFCYNRGFAGVNPVPSGADPTDPSQSGGDSFDLAEVGLAWVRFVKIQSTGDNWMVDRNGDVVRHTAETGANVRSLSTSGFDLDAVTAVNY